MTNNKTLASAPVHTGTDRLSFINSAPVLNGVGAHVTRGLSLPSCGVRIINLWTTAMLMEEATDNTVRMPDLFDWFYGRSGGSVLASAFAMRTPYSAEVLRGKTIQVVAEEFGHPSSNILFNNILHDISNAQNTDGFDTEQLKHVFNVLRPYLEPALRETLKGDNSANWLTKQTRGMGERILRKHLEDLLSKHKDGLRIAFQSAARKYLADNNPHRYDHNVLERAITRDFGDLRMEQAPSPLFLSAFSYDQNRLVLFGSANGIPMFPAHEQDSPFTFLANGDVADPDYVPVYTQVRVVDAIQASTSLPSIIGQREIRDINGRFGDYGEHALTVLPLIMDELSLRTQVFLQNGAKTLKPTTRRFWPFFNKTGVTPVSIQRVFMMGAGRFESDHSRGAEGGLISNFSSMQEGAQQTAISPALPQIRRLYNRTSRAYLGGLEAVSCVDKLLPPTQGNMLDHTTNGSVAHIAAMTRFAADMFYDNAQTIYNELALSLQVLERRRVITQDAYDHARDALNRNFSTKSKLQALCERAVLSEDTVQEIVNDGDEYHKRHAISGQWPVAKLG